MADNNDSNLSYALLARKQFLELLNQLKITKEFVPTEMARIAELMSNYDPIFYPLIIDELKRVESEELLKKFEYLISALDYRGFVPLLIKLLPEVTEKPELKRIVIRLLKYYHADFSVPPLKDYLKQEKDFLSATKEALLNSSEQSIAELHRHMIKFYSMDNSQMVSFVKSLLGNGEKAVAALDLLLRTGIDEVIVAALNTLGMIKSPKSITVLRRAFRYLPQDYKELVEKNIRRLKFMWVSEEQDYEDNKWQVQNCLVSFPYFYGYRYVGVLVFNGKDRHFIFFTIDEDIGIKRLFCASFMNNDKKYERFIERYRKDFNMKYMSLDYTALIMKDGVRKNYLNGVFFPPLFPVVSFCLPFNLMKPFPYDPTVIKSRVGDYKNRYITEEEEKKIFDIISQAGWLSADERFKDIVKKWYSGTEKKSVYLNHLLVRKTLRELIIPNLYRWKERLLLLADFLYNIEENRELIPAVIALSDSLVENVEEMENNEFMKMFIICSKEMVLKEEWD